MNWQTFLDELAQEGIMLWPDGDNLAFEDPYYALTTDRLQTLKTHKHDLLHFLRHATTQYPLSSGQQGLWFDHQMMPEGFGYNVSLSLRIHSVVEPATLEYAFQLLVNRHPALRTTFPLVEGQPVQQVRRYQQVQLEQVDASQWTEQELKKRVSATHERPFDLAQGPLFRLSLFTPNGINNDTPRKGPPPPAPPPTVGEGSGWGAPALPPTVGEGRRSGAETGSPSLLLEEGLGVGAGREVRPLADHILLFTLHHLICDGWSIWLMLDQLRTLFTAVLADDPAELPALPCTYGDYVAWEARILQENAEQLWGYWQRVLAGELPLLNLPTDQPPPVEGTYRGALLPLVIPPALLRQLTALARSCGVTLYMVLLAAFQLLLQRYTGQDDILVGSPIAGRSRPEFASIVGYFTSLVVMRADLSANLYPQGMISFREFLGQVRQTVLGAFEHQDFPFPLLVERLQVPRTAGVSPIYQAMFALQKAQTDPQLVELMTATSTEPQDFGGLRLSSFPLPQYEGQFDLFLELFHTPTALTGALKYNPDLFVPATIERMSGHLQTLLRSIVTDPSQSIHELSLLSAAERHQILVEWNDTAADYRSDKCIHQLFEEQVARIPEAIAVITAPQAVTYHELNTRANQLAHYLQAQGVGPDVLVAICIERSIEMMVGLLGILKAGGVYMPLDPSLPAERLQFMCQDANVKVLLIHDAGEASPWDSKVILSEQEIFTVKLGSYPVTEKANPKSQCGPANLAYVFYTSGSTGQPKGVAMPHRALWNLIDWQRKNSHGTGRTLQFSPMSFDVSLQEIFSTLCVGGTLVLVSQEVRRDPFALLEYLKEQEINRLFLPPVALQQLAEVAKGEMPATLREVITAGEQLQITPAIADWFRDRQCVLHNQYGPTESHVVTAYRLADKVARSWRGASTLPPIGRPITNSQIYILDAHLQPVPIGVAGELHIGGAGLARGYLNRPQLTKEKFIPNPFGEGRLYKTGDLARYLPDGNLEFLGRKDNQVKIRGFRVELGEIESTLNSQPNVREAVVMVRGESANKQLVAYIVGDTVGDVAGLRDKLKQQLPDYMIPSAFVALEALPLTPNGKVDRRALAGYPLGPDSSALLSEDTFVPPSTPTEMALANIWSEVLGIEQVSIYDNFFELGGHSLLATQIVSRINSVFKITSRIQSLFEYPTIAELSKDVQALSIAHQMAQQAKQATSKQITDMERESEEW